MNVRSRDHSLDKATLRLFESSARALPGPGTAPQSPGTSTAQVTDVIGVRPASEAAPRGYPVPVAWMTMTSSDTAATQWRERSHSPTWMVALAPAAIAVPVLAVP